jgi:hypothetical protein
MNRGFWAIFVETCSKINLCTDPEVTKHFTGNEINNLDEWKTFTKDKIEYWKNLFSRQLSAVGKSNFNFNFDEKPDQTPIQNDKPIEEQKVAPQIDDKPKSGNDFFTEISTNVLNYFNNRITNG